MSITINGSGDINATGNDIELNSTGTTDVTLAVGGGSVGIGTATPTEKLTVVGDMSVDTDTLYVDSANNRVGVGTAAPGELLDVSGNIRAFGANSRVMFGPDGFEASIKYATDASLQIASRTGEPITFTNGTDGTEAARIDAGDFRIGNTSGTWPGTDGLILKGSGVVQASVNSSPSLYLNRGVSNGPVANFARSSTTVGSISVTVSSTAYNTTSDYRLKENVTELTGAIDRVKQVPVHRFNFIADPDKTVDGFLAHEVADVVPEAITGEKDGMKTEEYEVTPAVLDDDGNVVTEAVMGTREVPEYQGIDQSKLVPLLTQALKDAITKIEALETTNADMLARIEALEAV